MIGTNIRLRRKKLKLSQEQLAQGDWTRSYVSQIERGRIQPSIETLNKIANKLDTTVADLIGDQNLLNKAKATVLYPEICRQYLALLPKTPTTIVLAQLTNSLLTNSNLDIQLPPNPELYHLTARVLISQKKYPSAAELLQKALKLFDIHWRVLFMVKLYFVYEQLGDVEQQKTIKEELTRILDPSNSMQEFKAKLVTELKYETDPGRSTYLVTFLQAIDYGLEFAQAIELINS